MCASTAALVDVDLARASATTAFSLFLFSMLYISNSEGSNYPQNAYDDIASLSIAAEERGCHLPESLEAVVIAV